MKKILFICTGNTCRSAMAEYIFNYKVFIKKLDDEYIAFSAGVSVFDSTQATVFAKDAMRDKCIDINNHKSRQISEKDIKEAYLVICMTNRHAEIVRKNFPTCMQKVFSLSEYLHNDKDINDPYGMNYEEYKKTANQLDEICEVIIKKLEME